MQIITGPTGKHATVQLQNIGQNLSFGRKTPPPGHTAALLFKISTRCDFRIAGNDFFKWKMTIHLHFFDQTILQMGEQNRVADRKTQESTTQVLSLRMLDRAPQHSDRMVLGRKRQHPGKRESPLDAGWPQAGTAVGS